MILSGSHLFLIDIIVFVVHLGENWAKNHKVHRKYGFRDLVDIFYYFCLPIGETSINNLKRNYTHLNYSVLNDNAGFLR